MKLPQIAPRVSSPRTFIVVERHASFPVCRRQSLFRFFFFCERTSSLDFRSRRRAHLSVRVVSSLRLVPALFLRLCRRKSRPPRKFRVGAVSSDTAAALGESASTQRHVRGQLYRQSERQTHACIYVSMNLCESRQE